MLTNETRQFHVGLSIRGSLQVPADELEGLIEHEGRSLTGAEAKALLNEFLEKSPILTTFTGTNCDNQNEEGICLGHTVNFKCLSPLKCFCVGDHDYYAAGTPEEALELHITQTGEWSREDFTLDDVELVSESVLDMQWVCPDDPDESPGTLRQWLAEAAGPGWLSGTEA